MAASTACRSKPKVRDVSWDLDWLFFYEGVGELSPESPSFTLRFETDMHSRVRIVECGPAVTREIRLVARTWHKDDSIGGAFLLRDESQPRTSLEPNEGILRWERLDASRLRVVLSPKLGVSGEVIVRAQIRHGPP